MLDWHVQHTIDHVVRQAAGDIMKPVLARLRKLEEEHDNVIRQAIEESHAAKPVENHSTAMQAQVYAMPLIVVAPGKSVPSSNSSMQAQINDLKYIHEQHHSYHDEQL